jgi:aldehyde dehydrogenase (NAD+)
LKRVTLELGGKSPSLIFADANMEIAIKECLQGFVMLSGQICAASTRIYVEESIAPKFLQAFKTAVEGSVQIFGDPSDPSKFVGTIVDAHQHSRVKSYVEKGKTEGTLLTGGEPIGDKVIILTMVLIVGTVFQANCFP